MDSDIEFGQLEHIEPDPEVRPDRNRLLKVLACGEVDESDLPIFVDLDVMRDMEAHARTNTDVELGGVLLGGQCIDSEGQHFVVVREAIRAEHYEATRGSFKFTHETWEQITRQREEFPDDLQLVGWYHTHPDWGVFLSGMDMFICENFFNKDLDVALVIDPCRGDRGWFYWSDGEKKQKHQTSGFYLMANRYRANELEYYSQLYSQPIPSSVDSRYTNPNGDFAVQPIVNIHDQRSSFQSAAVMGILAIQMLVLGMIGYRVLAPTAESTKEKETVADLQEKLNEKRRDPNPVYQKILEQLVEKTGSASEGIIAEIEALEEQNTTLATSLEGHRVLNEDLKTKNILLTAANTKKDKQLTDMQTKYQKQSDELKQLKEEHGEDGEGKSSKFWSYSITWPVVLFCVALAAVGGIFIGAQASRQRFNEYDEREVEEDGE